MTTLGSHQIGNINILLKQANTQTISLAFKKRLPDDSLEPVDLTQYSSIVMNVKDKLDSSVKPFLSFSLGDGLTILGDNDEILSFTFTRQFVKADQTVFYYDILFTDSSGSNTLVGGEIKIRKVVTS
jgi:hypothetical protein